MDKPGLTEAVHTGGRVESPLLQSTTKVEPHDDVDRVLVIENSESPESREIASYYVLKRHIPSENIVAVHCTTTADMSNGDFEADLVDPIRRAIVNKKTAIDYIVLTRGIPLRYSLQSYSVDSGLMAMDSPILPIVTINEASIRAVQSPYFGKNEHFTHAKYGLYLVTRLDGYSVADAKALVDHSIAAVPSKGPFYFQASDERTKDTYGLLQDTMVSASEYLRRSGFESILSPLNSYNPPNQPLMGFVTWGSNSHWFSKAMQDRITFQPGAIAETYVSTSARNFDHEDGGQSKIADLIAQGVTGVKGYVSEPYTFALCSADILMARYTSGFNLAESFYMASPTLKWKDLVIGDPLCCPYAK